MSDAGDLRKNSEAPRRRRKRKNRAPRWSISSLLREFGLPVTLMAGCAYGVSQSRSSVAKQHKELGTQSDIYAIPQGEQLLVFSLGYRAAAADLLFGRTMVASGVHFSEKRIFHHLDAYLHGILTLDRKYLDVYKYADALLNLSTVEMPAENLRIARDIQEQGLKEFPHDAELWISVGQFIAYMAPQRLPEGEDKKEWRLRGARILQHACDIWPQHDKLPEACLGAATLLSKNGENEAAIQALERMIAVVDDERVRQRALNKLRILSGERAARRARENLQSLDSLRTSDLPVADRLRYQLLSPPFDPDKCRGELHFSERIECASSFQARSEIAATQRGR